MKSKLLVIVGPTAVGKTALGITLAKQFNGEIISGDSQQVYQHLDIGTAKVSPEEQTEIRHYLIDNRTVDANYSVFDFVTEAHQAIETIRNRGKLPIIVGGTGLYIQSLLEGYHLGGKVNQDKVLTYRQTLEDLPLEKLKKLIAENGLVIDQFNQRRAIRALELYKFGQGMVNTPLEDDILLIGLNDERDKLYTRINNRVDSMVEQGLLDEAKWLYDNYPTVQASRGIGYKELFPYFSGEISLETALDKLKQNTRRFAKRQITWFKNRMLVDFYKISDDNWQEDISRDVKVFLEKVSS